MRRTLHLTIVSIVLFVSVLALFATPALDAADETTAADNSHELILHAQRRVKADDGRFAVKREAVRWDGRKTAIVVCDMWNEHWCKGATRRVGELAPRMNEVLIAAREKGVMIIHCPSSCLDYYQDSPQRKLAQLAPRVDTKIPLQGWCHLDKDHEARLPIDDSDGGCDCVPQCKQGSPWRRQIATLDIESGDAITDSGEAYYLMRQRGITNVIVMGVHTNMCVLGRPFSVRQMVYQGQNVVLMRDLTDTMYNPRMHPLVSHFHGTELVTDHIERYWCPTIVSTDFTGKPPQSFERDTRPHVVMLIGEKEYFTNETLSEFAKEELQSRGLRCTLIHAHTDDINDFPGIGAIDSADLLVVSVRRRTLSEAQLAIVRRHVEAGKPVVGIRTASHAFSLRGDQAPPPKHASWTTFDAKVLGGNYQGHHGNSPPTPLAVAKQAGTHAILAGVDVTQLQRTGSLYQVSPLAPKTVPLLIGSVEGEDPEPVAWTHTYQGGRVFYTSLGHVGEFKQPAFRRFLANAIFWGLDRPVPEKDLAAKTLAQK